MEPITSILIAFALTCVFDHVIALEGGQPAAPGEFPYMVSIRDSRNVHICGGTIIGDTWVLTANPCYSRSWFGYVRYGSNLLDDEGQLPANTSLNVIKVSNVLYNPWAADKAPYTHDCVLIQLSEPIPFSDTVYPIELPYLDQEWPDNKNALILGWGQPNAWASQTELQKAEVPLFSDEYCYEYSYNGWQIPDIVVMKCGGMVNTTYHCYNDYGGPVVVDNIQFGILSYVFGYINDGRECGQYLNIYSPVSYFRSWIQETTGI
ncbi:hypothetical protein GWI33_005675 [Rhynchophorus ferrugineus]|uniref:Peptidase S1 domain-containing protein n=1 Tax=Rhynchophorus ferrugineus TaxID=354439 RepID=A0A834ISP0_RHYFE|nr:hypothetical protein GWI33_005675 [Rhynchophorus ferrugineus]